MLKNILKKVYLKTPMGITFNTLNKKLDKTNLYINEMIKLNDLQYRDLLETITGVNKIKHNKSIVLKTDFPIAYESDDHISPLGTAQDNTRNLRFTNRCIKEYGNKTSFLDLGCSGGGLVFDFALRGYDAIGLEGSDYSKKFSRANWRTIPNNLFTCDITKDFNLLEDEKTKKFKVISCWEVLEHIKEPDISPLLANVTKHLSEDGIFVGSISMNPEDPLHHTIENKDWWSAMFAKNGLEILSDKDSEFEFLDYTRGVGSGMFDMANYYLNPERGFHFVAKLKG